MLGAAARAAVVVRVLGVFASGCRFGNLVWLHSVNLSTYDQLFISIRTTRFVSRGRRGNSRLLYFQRSALSSHAMLPDDSEEDDLFREESMLRKIIEIDETACNGCGLCVAACHEGAIGLVEGKARLLR
ncbi:MAG: 4Fe-4S binding protein, partial [Collinsella sp.]|nr:4Fe-4S binding protein [Collinsella sp.]